MVVDKGREKIVDDTVIIEHKQTHRHTHLCESHCVLSSGSLMPSESNDKNDRRTVHDNEN